MRLKILLSGLLMMLIGAGAYTSFAQDKPAVADAFSQADVKRIAKDLIDQALQVTHAADIYGDLRRTLREVYLPAMRNLVQGDFPGVPAPDAKTAAAMAKLLTFMDYLRKAGDEIDPALSEHREAMVSDVAEQIAKTAKLPEIEDVDSVLKLPAIRKSFDAFYAVTKLLTGFTYEDTRSFSEFSAWANGLDLDFSQTTPGSGAAGVPTKGKIAKAQALVNDLIQASHVEEMVADLKRFVREVYIETAPMTDAERKQLLEQADQFEFTYTMQRAVAIAVAPSLVAAALSEEQLATLHGFIRSPAFTRAFDLLQNAVKSATAFTKEDIAGAQKTFEDLERKSKLQDRSSEEQDKAKAEWNALVNKWSELLKNRISPETRSGLEHAFDELQQSESPI